MSLQKSDKKQSGRRQYDSNQFKGKGSYTQQGFYRKSNNNVGMNLSNLSQKQSIYDHKFAPNQFHVNSQIGYSTLNPAKYSATPTHLDKGQQYQLLIEFQLKRQIEKNKILQERLKNKQIFISKMNAVQRQLTLGYQKCQQQLQFYKKKSLQPQPPLEIREYLQEISQLKHLVIRLQDKITQYQKKENKKYSSVKQSNKDQEQTQSITRFKTGFDKRQVRDKRSKTTVNQDSSPQFKKFDIYQEYIAKYPARITNFISRFLAMVQFFNEQARDAKRIQNNTKKRLKIGWKWIKEVVTEWNHNKKYIQKMKHFHKNLKKICHVPQNKDENQSMQLIISAFRK